MSANEAYTAPSLSEDNDPTRWPAETMAAIQGVLDRSMRSAGRAIRDTFGRPERQMSALEFVHFWNATSMKAMATVGADSAPHLAPVHAKFVQGCLRTTIFENAQRRADLRVNRRVAFTCWGPHGAVAIVYGRAREIPDSLREARAGAGANATPRRTVTLEVEITRIYAMHGREA